MKSKAVAVLFLLHQCGALHLHGDSLTSLIIRDVAASGDYNVSNLLRRNPGGSPKRSRSPMDRQGIHSSDQASPSSQRGSSSTPRRKQSQSSSPNNRSPGSTKPPLISPPRRNFSLPPIAEGRDTYIAETPRTSAVVSPGANIGMGPPTWRPEPLHSMATRSGGSPVSQPGQQRSNVKKGQATHRSGRQPARQTDAIPSGVQFGHGSSIRFDPSTFGSGRIALEHALGESRSNNNRNSIMPGLGSWHPTELPDFYAARGGRFGSSFAAQPYDQAGTGPYVHGTLAPPSFPPHALAPEPFDQIDHAGGAPRTAPSAESHQAWRASFDEPDSKRSRSRSK